MYPLGTWFVSGICGWITCIKETMMMMMMMLLLLLIIIIIIIIIREVLWCYIYCRQHLTEHYKTMYEIWRPNAGTRHRGTINNKDRIAATMYPLRT